MPYLRVVIILFSTSLYKLAYSIYSFVKVSFRLTVYIGFMHFTIFHFSIFCSMF